MTNNDLIRAFANQQQRRGLRPATIERRATLLRRLADDIAPRQLLEATRHDIETLLACPITARTRCAYLSYLSCFYRWAILEDFATTDPTARIPRPRLPRLLPRPISPDDLRVALAMADPRMRCWLTLGAFAGLRCAEISALRAEHIMGTLTPPVIVVVDGKGGHQRVVPLHPTIHETLRALPIPRSGPVFPGRDGPMRPRSISDAVGQFLHGLGIDATAHRARHLFGTAVYRESLDLRLTQELLGHASPVTTAGYAAFAPAKAAAVVLSLSLV